MGTSVLRLVDGVVMVMTGAAVILMGVLAVGGAAGEAMRLAQAVFAAGAAYGLARVSLVLRGGLLGPLGWVGATAAAAAFVLSMLLLSGGGRSVSQSDQAVRCLLLLILVALLAADVVLVTRWPLRRLFIRVVAGIALCTVAVPLLLTLIACLADSWEALRVLSLDGPRGTGWLLVTVLAGVVAHMVLPTLGNWERRSEATRLAAMVDRALATLQCPRCEQWLQMRSGLIACPSCALVIRLEFNEPRCRCGYPLHRLAGGCCPECGRDVPANDRWGRTARGGGSPSVSPPVPSPPSA